MHLPDSTASRPESSRMHLTRSATTGAQAHAMQACTEARASPGERRRALAHLPRARKWKHCL
eukprot:9312831-Pyramimonas_sp.AAC.1